MGPTIDALSDTGRLLTHNPIIIAVGWVALVMVLVANAVLGLIPLIGNLLSLFIFPAFLALLLGIIYAGRNGDASLDDGFRSLSDHYLSMLGGSVLVGALFLIVGLGGLLVTTFVFSFGSGLAGGVAAEPSPAAMLGSFLVPLLVVGLVLLLIQLVVQFWNVAIVVEDRSAIASVRRSVSLALSAPVSVIGYTLVQVAIGALFLLVPIFGLGAVFGGTSVAMGAGGAADGGILGALGLGVLVGLLFWLTVLVPLGQIITYTYRMAFYNRHLSLGTL